MKGHAAGPALQTMLPDTGECPSGVWGWVGIRYTLHCYLVPSKVNSYLVTSQQRWNAGRYHHRSQCNRLRAEIEQFV